MAKLIIYMKFRKNKARKLSKYVYFCIKLVYNIHTYKQKKKWRGAN